MAIYRFRVILEDNDDVYRDIDIKSGQSFEELHLAIQDAYKFDKKHAASFFVSDDYWRKGQEITLNKADLAHDEIDIKKNAPPKKLMAETKIAKYIDAPRQRFVYVFDPNAQWSFMLELIKIDSENPKTKYPVCVKTAGTAPKQYKVLPSIKEEPTGDMALAALLGGLKKDEDEDDTEAYKAPLNTEVHAVEEEDLKELEGEEGDESAEESEDGDVSMDEEDGGSGGETYGFEEDEH
jgi:hypothetical protein